MLRTEAKLKKFVKKLEQEVKEGIPLAPSTSPVSYKRELDDKVKNITVGRFHGWMALVQEWRRLLMENCILSSRK